MQAFLPHRDETHETVARPRTASGASGCAAARKLRIDDRSGIAAPIRKKKERLGAAEQIAGIRAFPLGAEHRVRTGDLRLGKATLYQLS